MSKGEYPYVRDFQTVQHAKTYTHSSSVHNIYIESKDLNEMVTLSEELW
jgi:hypothetical protein